MSVTAKDAQATLAAILRTFNANVCPGHQSPDPDDLDVICDGMCAWDTARKTLPGKSYAEMDATPTLCDNEHECLPKGCWSIFWEGGNAPEEWTYDLSNRLAENVREATGGRVFIEPINTCILGVFPS
jgi:hypothetical protein